MRSHPLRLGLALLCACLPFSSGCVDDGGTDDSTNTTPDTTTLTTTTAVDSTDTNTSSDSADSSTTTIVTTTTDTTDQTSTVETTTETSSTTTETETASEECTDPANPACKSDIADRLVDALCSWSGRCCNSGEFDAILGPSVTSEADCTERMLESLHDNDNRSESERLSYVDQLFSDLAYEVDLSRSTPIADAVTVCMAELGTRACNTVWSYDRCTPPEDDPCALAKLFVGKLGAGAECNGDLRGPFRDIECTYGTNCEDVDPSDSRADYRCVTKGKVGEFCEPESENSEGSCEFDLYCENTTGTCQLRPGLGEACSYIEADAPHVTDLDALYQQGVDPDAIGDGARGNEKVPCEAGLQCDPLRLQCVTACSLGANCQAPTDEWGNPGEDDAIDALAVDNDYLGCPAGLSCLPHEFATNIGEYYFHCGAPRTASLLCNSDLDCITGSYCSGVSGDSDTYEDDSAGKGVCKLNVTEGRNCGRDGECGDGLFCGSCALAQERGAPGPGIAFTAVNYPECFDSLGDPWHTGTTVCQQVLPVTGPDAEEVRCAVDDDGDDDDDIAASVRRKDSACSSAEGCVYSDKLSDGTQLAEPDYYCLSVPQPSNAKCEPGSGASYLSSEPNFQRFFFSQVPTYAPGKPSDQASRLFVPGIEVSDVVWSNHCANNYICADTVGGIGYDIAAPYNCIPGVPLHGRCDYDRYTTDVGYCSPGLHCVNGSCEEFLSPGDPCDPEMNPVVDEDGVVINTSDSLGSWWTTHVESIRLNGFVERICNPDSSTCDSVHGGHYCTVFDANVYRTMWCVGAEGSN